VFLRAEEAPKCEKEGGACKGCSGAQCSSCQKTVQLKCCVAKAGSADGMTQPAAEQALGQQPAIIPQGRIQQQYVEQMVEVPAPMTQGDAVVVPRCIQRSTHDDEADAAFYGALGAIYCGSHLAATITQEEVVNHQLFTVLFDFLDGLDDEELRRSATHITAEFFQSLDEQTSDLVYDSLDEDSVDGLRELQMMIVDSVEQYKCDYEEAESLDHG